jgi:hypothetical protein
VIVAAPRLFEVPLARHQPCAVPLRDHARRRPWRRCSVCATYRVTTHHSLCPICVDLITAYPTLWLESF